MKYSIGYQLPDQDDSILSIVTDYRNYVAEVYFSWPGDASGRSPLCIYDEEDEETIVEVFKDELSQLSLIGIDLVLLFNANCYGRDAISNEMQKKVCSLLDTVTKTCSLRAVTTTSPFIAAIIKHNFPTIETRASINMRIGTIKGMEYLSDYFDAYYLQREHNRNVSYIHRLKSWCDIHEKKLYMLANSGCLNFCSSQTYHDNLIAHEAEIVQKSNVPLRFPSPCWEYMEKRENWVTFLQNSWIRPEDIHHYETLFDTVKLATRMHANPRKIIDAWSRKKFRGNLLDLTEPGYGCLFNGYIIDNTRFPRNWFDKTSTCDNECHQCGYCKNVLNEVLVYVGDTW